MKRLLLHVAAALAVVSVQPAVAQERPAPVVFRAEVQAAAPRVWNALTTVEGVRSFFAQEALLEARIGGAYEIYFLPGNPPGLRGSEGVHILAMEPPTRLLISWNAPTHFGSLREQQTIVEIELKPGGEGRTLLTLTHNGWGRGPGWMSVRDYFASAWPHVLGRLQYRFDRGPVDWRDPPDGAAHFRGAAEEAVTR